MKVNILAISMISLNLCAFQVSNENTPASQEAKDVLFASPSHATLPYLVGKKADTLSVTQFTGMLTIIYGLARKSLPGVVIAGCGYLVAQNHHLIDEQFMAHQEDIQLLLETYAQKVNNTRLKSRGLVSKEFTDF